MKNTIKIGKNGIVQHLLYVISPSWHYAPRLLERHIGRLDPKGFQIGFYGMAFEGTKDQHL